MGRADGNSIKINNIFYYWVLIIYMLMFYECEETFLRLSGQLKRKVHRLPCFSYGGAE